MTQKQQKDLRVFSLMSHRSVIIPLSELRNYFLVNFISAAGKEEQPGLTYITDELASQFLAHVKPPVVDDASASASEAVDGARPALRLRRD
ncbi:hypothetical protein EVAR_61377_1 [Eumeta japonica]|uniref:Uncharacterized protein n=1 Tax=Eumeta variegata TaxID=151549 RepID=A0A4C1ZAM3_EUMVA|nr:hypothetical protein EVAR_61377_1 [Eumeta japonica]